MSRLKIAGGAAGGAGAASLVALAMAFIPAKEGLRTTAYRDSIGVPTICIGETQGVRMGMRMTKDECVKLFQRRLDRDYANAVERCVPDAKDPAKMKAEPYVAFASLAYNIGAGGFCKSSPAKLWNAGRHRDACLAIDLYNRAGGRVLKGLVNRRRDEVKLCLKGV